MNLQYGKSAVKAINSMDTSTKKRIKSAIEGLLQAPPTGDIKVMQGFTEQIYRLRVGKYRIIYKMIVDNMGNIVYIIDIGSRGDIYK